MKHSKNVKKASSIFQCFFLIIFLALFFSIAATGCGAISNIASGDLNTAEEHQEGAGSNLDSNGSTSSENPESEKDKAGDAESQKSESASTDEKKSDDNGEDDSKTDQAKEIEIDPSLQTINVYYADSTAEYLVGEARDVEGKSKLVDAFYELMKDPVDSSLFVLVPSATKINSIKLYDDGIAKVDLSQSFLDERFQSDTVDNLLLYAIVNTLTEFKEVLAVEIYIDGEKLDILGQLDIKDPVHRRSDIIIN